jgi:hypothetical protein
MEARSGLERLAEMMPNRYRRDEFGHWTCPPGVRVAEQFGLYYRLRSSAEIDWVLQRNFRFLEDYLAPGPQSPRQKALDVQPRDQLNDALGGPPRKDHERSDIRRS